MIKDLQLDPVRDRAIHVDFQQVRLDRVIQTMVAVHLEGTPHGVTMGGVLSQPIHELNIEVLPTAVPEQLLVDISGLDIGDALRLADIPAPEGVTFLDDLESTVVASVTAPSVEEEPEPEEARRASRARRAPRARRALPRSLATPPRSPRPTSRCGSRAAPRRRSPTWWSGSATRVRGTRPPATTSACAPSRRSLRRLGGARGAAAGTAGCARPVTATSGWRCSCRKRS